MSTNQVDKILKFYKTIAKNPTLSSARILPSKNTQSFIIQSNWSQRNLEKASNQKYSIDYILSNDFQVVDQRFPIDVTTELLSEVSSNNKYRAVLRSIEGKDKDNSSSNKQAIEIWSNNLVKYYDIPALDVHGDVYSDSDFGSFAWSSDSKKLLYIAEKKLEKSEPFYKQKSLDKKNDDKTPAKETLRGEEYKFKPDWGEQMVGKHLSTVCILDTELDVITTQAGIPDELSPGQVIWAPNDDAIVGVAWNHEPRYLGLIYCTNRESWIFRLKDGKIEKLSSDGCCVRSPRFSPDGKHLIWLERDLNGPHHHAHRLMHLDWKDELGKPDILIDVVRKCQIIQNDKPFYGLYNHDFPRRCWSNDSRFLFFATQQRSNVRSYVFDMNTKELSEIENNSSSLSILDVKNDTILFAKTSLMESLNLYVGRFNSNTPDKIKINLVSSSIPISGLENAIYESNEYVYDNDEEIKDFNYIYFGPKSGSDNSCPLIVTPHGGPHSAYANIFSLESTLLVLLGYGIVQVNYRGSIGMGADNVEYLQGRVGDTDVIDCVTATREALKKYSWLDPDRVGLSGGSHGGFLVSHLSARYNTMYKSVISRNPVTDISVMFSISDIPDWCASAIKEPYRESLKNVPKASVEEMLLKMFKCSPIVHVDRVTAPTLLNIGKNDLRVPPSQGKQWYHRLKANGVKTKMHVYDDSHPLSSGPVEIDAIINGVLWHCENLNVDIS